MARRAKWKIKTRKRGNAINVARISIDHTAMVTCNMLTIQFNEGRIYLGVENISLRDICYVENKKRYGKGSIDERKNTTEEVKHYSLKVVEKISIWVFSLNAIVAVSYTHLDVYKRQVTM